LKLPLVVSVPHAGQQIPEYLTERILLNGAELEAEGDRGARGIFAGLEPLVEAYRAIDIARAILDVDRSEEDRSRDGVIKTHTRGDQLIWDGPIEDETVQRLIEAYYRPYHTDLSNFASSMTLDGVALSNFRYQVTDGAGAGSSWLSQNWWYNDEYNNSRLQILADATAITPPIHEPETYAMMLAGLTLLGFQVRRKKAKRIAT